MRKGQRKFTLSLVEEQALQEKREDILATQLHQVIQKTFMMNVGEAAPERRLANSLIWIWVKMKPDQVKRNVWIAMLARDIFTIAELGKRTGLNTSGLSRALTLKIPAHFVHWNTNLLFPVAQVLGVRPELLLEMDLRKTVLEQIVN